MEKLTLPCMGITITWPDGNPNKASITSDIKEDESTGSILFNSAVDGILSTVLGHFIAGIDVSSPGYIEGIETALLKLEPDNASGMDDKDNDCKSAFFKLKGPLDKSPFTVIGYYEDTDGIFAHHVEAHDMLHSFHVAAEQYSEAVFIASMPGDVTEGSQITFPGEQTLQAYAVLQLPEKFKLSYPSYLWRLFSEIPIDENDAIEQNYLHFEAGTDRIKVWHWFEDNFDCSVTDL